MLVFRSWFSLANGISQTVQNVIYPKDVLALGVAPMSAFKVVTQVGQLAISPTVGRWSDRFGNRPVLMAGQACVSASLLFYIAATGPDTRWLLAGAWVLYAAYAAHNICLPNLVLKLSGELDKPAYVASNEALGSLFHATATVAGGLAFDWLRQRGPEGPAGTYRSCLMILVTAMVMRSIGVGLLAAIREPGAWTWREIVAGQLAAPPDQHGPALDRAAESAP